MPFTATEEPTMSIRQTLPSHTFATPVVRPLPKPMSVATHDPRTW
jgi:hypothetical protein